MYVILTKNTNTSNYFIFNGYGKCVYFAFICLQHCSYKFFGIMHRIRKRQSITQIVVNLDAA